ncbi:MAG TPA: tetratricopeptide repeat protein [Ramlibacter sp.]|uniref:tetratricopeptide repeat protein n=1 Tax=Ramlibacter sp. TaxID=1917967 RepID=UPI002ED53889
MAGAFEQARTLFLEGVAHYEAGRLEPAERHFAAALALAPGRPSVLTNLGTVRLKLGRTEEALALLQEAVALEPDNAEALGHCATAHAELGHLPQALAMFERALAIAIGPAPVLWMYRGNVLKALGRPDEAAGSYREALARGGDAELLNYYLAGLAQGDAPAHPPRHYVEGLFDGYAGEFDRHVVEALRYDAPQVLVGRLAALGRRWAHAVDLGCGTGLCGRLLRPLVDRLGGVDLSAGMLEKAAAQGVYDDLQRGDVLEHLQASRESIELAICADVFIYVGALEGVFAALARRMPAGGSFCFSVEESREGEVVLRPSLRYAHSEPGIRRLAEQHGFRVVAMERRAVREDQGEPIPGLFFWLEKA